MSPVAFADGCFTIVFGGEVLVVGLVVKHMPYGYEQFARHRHENLHLVLLANLCLMEGESAEEAVLGPAGSPGTLDDGLSQEYIAMSDSARLDFLVGLVITWLQSAPGCEVCGGLEFGHVDSDLCDQ